MSGAEGTVVRSTHSSLPLEITLFLGSHYGALFFVINLCLYTYKSVKYYYPGKFLAWDLVTLFMYVVIDQTRVLMASKGNKTSTALPLVFGLVLSLPIIVLHSYYISLQTYILRVDVVMNSIGLILVIIEFLLAITLVVNITSASKRI